MSKNGLKADDSEVRAKHYFCARAASGHHFTAYLSVYLHYMPSHDYQMNISKFEILSQIEKTQFFMIFDQKLSKIDGLQNALFWFLFEI